MLAHHPPPAVAGRRLKIKYVTQAKTRPPGFVVSCSRPDAMPQPYLRYLSNSLREAFDMCADPHRLAHLGKSVRRQGEKTPLSAVSSSSHFLQLSCLAFSGLSSSGRDRRLAGCGLLRADRLADLSSARTWPQKRLTSDRQGDRQGKHDPTC
ncbi:MAG: hypothetical protein E5X83_07745 [Mesorhizobium sp.]|nr:MAG: hypothetical protein EOR82_01680 [Mesorhizobium sp.]TIO26288.1 MAG: hypothetical protein E5X83_07745 [Mesorhizobium sp.]TJV61339.1 MAG: hypothetical protein E5X82_10995 [Mesorhizobium sp.]